VLDEDKVKAIRASKLGQRELARQYGVSQSTIWRARNTRWLHVMGNA
jgi:transposase-like protein